MIAGNPKLAALVKLLDHTRIPLRTACLDLGLDYEHIVSLGLDIDQCAHCGIWSKRLILDLDSNPICSVCRDLAGL